MRGESQLKDADSMATSFDIPAKKSITKKLSSLSVLRRKQKSQNGILLVESENRDVTCQITKLPFSGSSSVESNDIVWGTSYLISAPNILKSASSGAKGRIVVYNLANTLLDLEIESYDQTGITDNYKELKSIGIGKKRILNLKDVFKNITYHLIPKEIESSRYFAYLEITDKDGKQYLIKNSQEINETLINNAKGTLVVSNTNSTPTSFAYAISSGGKKVYQGNEWLMPYSQRIFNLKKYTKKLSSPKIRIKAGNLFKDKECRYNKEKNDYDCYYLL